jgi:hypothetical protein
MMFRAAYRKFVGTGAHEAIVVSHSVVAGSRTAPRWYEIRNPNGTTPVIFQQGTVAPADSNFRWMPSVGMDKNGDIALGYSVSSSATKPSIRYTGRVPTDAQGTMQAEKTIVAGTGVQQSNTFHRWGDYSSMAIDRSGTPRNTSRRAAPSPGALGLRHSSSAPVSRSLALLQWQLSRLFEPFFTTKEKGTGLGLWVTKRLVDKHKGSIKFRSRFHPEMGGTCFAVFLPSYDLSEGTSASA